MEDFYHAEEESFPVEDSRLPGDGAAASDPTIYLKVSSILFVRAGLFLSQVSSIPSSNIQVLIFQNIIDVAVNTVVYSLVGYLFAFGKDFGTFIGIDGFLSDETDRNEFAEGWLIVVAVSGLLVAAIGDRVSFFASLVVNALLSGVVLPIVVHWTLSERGWMRRHAVAGVKVSFKDYGYSCLVHMSGGSLALLSMIVLNKRLLRFKDMDACSIPDNGPSLTLFGNLFMIIGFFGIGVPTEKYLRHHQDFNFYGIVLVNMLLSAFGAVASTLLLTFSCPCEPMHKWTSMRSIQAGISGIAVIAAGADVYYPLAALLIGLCNGFLFFLVSFLVNVSPIEDYSNIVACHLVSGFAGSLLPPVFGVREGFDCSPYYTVIHVAWQFACDVAVLAFVSAVIGPVVFLLDYCSVLRSWEEDINHRRAMFASKTIKSETQPPSPAATAYEWTGQEQTVSYLDSGGYKPPEPSPALSDQEAAQETDQEQVDVLFEKKPSPMAPPDEGPKADSAVNYVLCSKPMMLFEEICPRESSAAVRESGDDYVKGSRFFDVRLVKGIKNISDSRLFQKFKDNWTVPKRRGTWHRDRELRFGSMSNIWVASSPLRLRLETEV